MSQTYHCTLKESVQQTVRLGDTITHRLSLTPILPEEDMRGLLREALRDAGFTEQSGDQWTLDDAQAVTTVDLQQMTVQTDLHQEQTITTEAVAHGRGWSDRRAQQAAQEQLDEARQDAKASLQKTAHQLQQQATHTVGNVDSAHTALLHQILQEVYAESLKQKARQLGDVTELREGTNADGEYELIIKVET